MNGILFYFLIALFATLIVALSWSFLVKIQRMRRNFREKYVVVQVRVSKENETGPIAAEHIFATLQGLKANGAENVSFEIASIDQTIAFYVSFPRHLRNLVEGQIYAQYNDVEICECEDYSKAVKFPENAVGVELTLRNSDIYPVKRYTQFEDRLTKTALDPLAGVTSTLLKFQDAEDQAWIQLTVTPLSDRWRIIFTRCVRILYKGIFGNIESLTNAYARAFTTRKVWPKVLFSPIYFIFWLQGLFVTAFEEEKGGKDDIEETLYKMHDRETAAAAAMDKVVRPLFESNLRIVYVPKNFDAAAAELKIKEIVGAFKQFDLPHLNGFEPVETLKGHDLLLRYQKRLITTGFVLNNEELATLYHLPNLTVKTPTIYWVKSKKLETPHELPLVSKVKDLTILGKSNFRGSNAIFGIKPEDRRRHLYIIGKTGMGKSTVLENMIYADIEAGRGVGVVDPHGDLAESVLNFIPQKRINDVILIDPADKEYAVAFNMLENVDPELNSIVASGLVGILKKIYGESWGPRLEHILRNSILSLLEYPGTTMLGITRILQDYDFRQKVVKKIEDPVVKSFWVNEFEKMQEKSRIDAISPILNKVGQFLSSRMIRDIVGQPKSSFNLRFAMDKGKIVIVNLSKGKIGEDNSALLGAMFITKFQLDAMSRANIPEKERKDFYLYVDEFQNFATESFATILSEARKYRLNLTMANQYIAQMPEEVRDAVFGNVGSILSFQVGFDDAEYISQQFGEEVLPPDLVSLSKYGAYMRLLVDGMPTRTFSLDTLPPPVLERDEERIEKMIRVSRERYSEKRDEVEDKIKRWSRTEEEKKPVAKKSKK